MENGPTPDTAAFIQKMDEVGSPIFAVFRHFELSSLEALKTCEEFSKLLGA